MGIPLPLVGHHGGSPPLPGGVLYGRAPPPVPPPRTAAAPTLTHAPCCTAPRRRRVGGGSAHADRCRPVTVPCGGHPLSRVRGDSGVWSREGWGTHHNQAVHSPPRPCGSEQLQPEVPPRCGAPPAALLCSVLTAPHHPPRAARAGWQSIVCDFGCVHKRYSTLGRGGGGLVTPRDAVPAAGSAGPSCPLRSRHCARRAGAGGGGGGRGSSVNWIPVLFCSYIPPRPVGVIHMACDRCKGGGS